MRLTPFLLALATSAAALAGPLAPARAADTFAPVIQVNDRAITGYELDQRLKFLTILNMQGDLQEQAEKGLIDDRLRMAQAEAEGVTIAPAELQAGMDEFAGRANLSTDQFIQAIGQGGVDAATFRDFVKAGVAWRAVVRNHFAGRVMVSEAEVDRALSADVGRGAGPRVLISEIYIPARMGEVGLARAEADDLVKEITGEASFAKAAELHSAAASRLQGGRVDWVPLANLPPQVQQALSKLQQGQVSGPVPMAGYVGLFMLRGTSPGGDIVKSAVITDYAQVLLPAATAKAEADRIRAKAGDCDDLYSLAPTLPANSLTRAQEPRSRIPANVGAVLDGLDAGESNLTQTSGGNAALIMLCSRNASVTADSLAPVTAPLDPVTGTTASADGVTPAIVDGLGAAYGPSRDQARDELTNRKIGMLAELYLAELRAQAIITRP